MRSRFREKAADRQKRLLAAEQYLRLGYFLFEGVNETAERQLQQSVSLAITLSVGIERVESDLLQPLALIPLPLCEEQAATVRTALNNYLIPTRDFCDKLCLWIAEFFIETAAAGTAPNPEQRQAKWAEIRRARLETDAMKWGYYVELGPFPYRSLGIALLLDDRWIDARLLECAEYAALLRFHGFLLQNPPGSHPLEPLLVVNAIGTPASEHEVLDT